MNRRRFIIGLAGLTVFLAGCSEIEQSGAINTQRTTAPVSTPLPTTTEFATEPVAEEHLDAAFEAIEIAYEDLRSELDELDTSLDFVEFHTTDISAEINRAESELSSVESLGTNEQVLLAENLLSVIAWLRPMTNGLADYSDALQAMDRGDTYFENERFLDGAEQFETASNLLTSADDLLVAADTNFDAIDTTQFENAAVDITRARESMEMLDTAVVGMSYYSRGSRAGLEGFEHFRVASSLYDEGRFDEAASRYRDAHDQFSDAHEIFREGENEAPDWLLEPLIDLTCTASSYRDASAHAEVGMHAANEGDIEAEQIAFNSALQALNRCS